MLSKHKLEMGSIGVSQANLKIPRNSKRSFIPRSALNHEHGSTSEHTSDLQHVKFGIWHVQVCFLLIYLDYFKSRIKKKKLNLMFVMWGAIKTKFANHWPGNTALWWKPMRFIEKLPCDWMGSIKPHSQTSGCSPMALFISLSPSTAPTLDLCIPKQWLSTPATRGYFPQPSRLAPKPFAAIRMTRYW